MKHKLLKIILVLVVLLVLRSSFNFTLMNTKTVPKDFLLLQLINAKLTFMLIHIDNRVFGITVIVIIFLRQTVTEVEVKKT